MTVFRRWSLQDAYNDAVYAAASRYNVPVSLVKATIAVESAFNKDAINKSDPGWAWGLMQMIPSTARGLGYSGAMDQLLSDPALAVDLGTKLLAENLRRTNGAVADSVSAYNGGFRPSLGFGAKRSSGTYANQAYVDRVLDAFDYFNQWEAQQKGVVGSSPTPFRVEPSSDGAVGAGRVVGREARSWWQTVIDWIKGWFR